MKYDSEWTGVVFNHRDPLYLQVIRHFKELIAMDKLQASQIIPSRRELGALLKINPNTAQRAYKEMEEQKLIVTEGNSPSRITSDEQILRSIRTELLTESVDLFLLSVQNINVPLDELLELVSRKYTHLRKEGQ
ncbi:MAG TPA: GntR family transcriptional regulator [Candidatus Paenibacillus intestinavium]|nr:GntR family transcriptional regulator [Candidatus Paenibacillus intestinavium]